MLIDAQPYNITKFEIMSNVTGTIITDHEEDTLIGYVRAGEGEPTFTFSAIPAGDEIAEYANLFGNIEEGEWSLETDDFKLIVSGIQFTDSQGENASGVLETAYTNKIGGFRFQLK